MSDEGTRFFWNHRVIRHTHGNRPDSPRGEEETILAIHEAHYSGDPDQSPDPHSISMSPTPPLADTLEELRAVLLQMLASLDKPILDSSEFDNSAGN